jgi:hypothetical protein
MPTFNQKEALLILSGIASEASNKNKAALDPQLYTQIFESFMNKSVKNQDVVLMSYSQLATVVWSFTITKIHPEKNLQFWSQVI